MTNFESSRSESEPSKLPALIRGTAVVAGMTLLLAGCGHGKNEPAASAPPSASAAVAHATPPASATPAALPTQPPAALSSAEAAQKAAAEAKAKLSSMSVADLLSSARTAYSQHRLVAPAGDNAMEYYEAVLAKDPNNEVAKDALRETFPFGVPDVEKAISANDFDEADREIALLAKADPTNYTLTLLRSKLDAQKKAQARLQQQQQEKAQKAEQTAAAQQAAAAKAAAEKEAAAKLAAQQAAAAKAAPPPKPVEHEAPPAPKPAGETHGAVSVSVVQPQYPIEAARNQTSGYVVIEFTVEADGSVANAHVVNASPRGVFDNAGLQAVRRSKYKPAVQDGRPVSSVVQRRMDFKFGG